MFKNDLESRQRERDGKRTNHRRNEDMVGWTRLNLPPNIANQKSCQMTTIEERNAMKECLCTAMPFAGGN